MKKTKRQKNRYPALNKEVNLKTRSDLIEADYLDKLSKKELEWLNNFNEEYINANFKHSGKRIHKKTVKTKIVKKSGEIKEVDTEKQDAEARNNARNRCIFTREKAANRLNYYSQGGANLKYESELDEKLNDLKYTDEDPDNNG